MGFAMNVEGDQGEGDDTAVNGVRMICSGGNFFVSFFPLICTNIQ